MGATRKRASWQSSIAFPFSWGGRIRTCNLPVNSRALRQLSYTPSSNRRSIGEERAADPRRLPEILLPLARPEAITGIG